VNTGGDFVDVLVFFIVKVELRDSVRFAFDGLGLQLEFAVTGRM
jgi:hypothetical protein